MSSASLRSESDGVCPTGKPNPLTAGVTFHGPDHKAAKVKANLDEEYGASPVRGTIQNDKVLARNAIIAALTTNAGIFVLPVIIAKWKSSLNPAYPLVLLLFLVISAALLSYFCGIVIYVLLMVHPSANQKPLVGKPNVQDAVANQYGIEFYLEPLFRLYTHSNARSEDGSSGSTASTLIKEIYFPAFSSLMLMIWFLLSMMITLQVGLGSWEYFMSPEYDWLGYLVILLLASFFGSALLFRLSYYKKSSIKIGDTTFIQLIGFLFLISAFIGAFYLVSYDSSDIASGSVVALTDDNSAYEILFVLYFMTSSLVDVACQTRKSGKDLIPTGTASNAYSFTSQSILWGFLLSMIAYATIIAVSYTSLSIENLRDTLLSSLQHPTPSASLVHAFALVYIVIACSFYFFRAAIAFEHCIFSVTKGIRWKYFYVIVAVWIIQVPLGLGVWYWQWSIFLMLAIALIVGQFSVVMPVFLMAYPFVTANNTKMTLNSDRIHPLVPSIVIVVGIVLVVAAIVGLVHM